MGSSKRAKSKRVRRSKPKSWRLKAEFLFSVHYLQTQLQALRALAETGKELASQHGGFASVVIWEAIMTSLTEQISVLGYMSVELQP
jgi:hypothetical protein